MCRNIRTLHNFEPPATPDEIQAAALQYVRKISGSTRPSKANQEAFDRAARRLCLTGTPFRTKPGERIPFVRYSEVPDGEPGELRSSADYTYGYREALRDGVVRPPRRR